MLCLSVHKCHVYNYCAAVQHERGPRKAKHPPLPEKHPQASSPTVPQLSPHSGPTVHHHNGSRMEHLLPHHRSAKRPRNVQFRFADQTNRFVRTANFFLASTWLLKKTLCRYFRFSKYPSCDMINIVRIHIKGQSLWHYIFCSWW